MLGLEVAKPQQAVQAVTISRAPICQSQLFFAEGKELRALEVIEIWQTVECDLFGVSEDRQPMTAVGAHSHADCEKPTKPCTMPLFM